MTEEEWLNSTEALRLLHVVRDQHKPSERKVRLFNVAICRRFWDYLPTESRSLLEESERVADGLTLVTDDPSTLCPRANAAVAPFDRQYPDKRFPNAEFRIRRDAAAAVCYAVLPGELWGAGGYFTDIDPGENLHQSVIIRDIFGNPFRPVAFSAEWRTDTAVSLARGMYESREFGAMPILADALQDAGCDNDDLLNHCRDANQVHVRGCWVVDLVLGKA